MGSAREKSAVLQSWPSTIWVLLFGSFSEGRHWTCEGRAECWLEYLRLKDRTTVHRIRCCSSFPFLPLALDFLGKQKASIRRQARRTPPSFTSLFTYWFSRDKLRDESKSLAFTAASAKASTRLGANTQDYPLLPLGEQGRAVLQGGSLLTESLTVDHTCKQAVLIYF